MRAIGDEPSTLGDQRGALVASESAEPPLAPDPSGCAICSRRLFLEQLIEVFFGRELRDERAVGGVRSHGGGVDEQLFAPDQPRLKSATTSISCRSLLNPAPDP